MSQPFQIDSTRQEELLREATSRRAAAVVTCKTSDGWTTSKSRFLGMDAGPRHLFLAYPSNSGPAVPEIVGGQSIGVSFRRGHKKCVFNTIVLERCRFPFPAAKGIPALKLGWPEEMCELQRRLYYRALVPGGTTIPAELWRGDAQGPQLAGAPVYRGNLLDLSAGGISVILAGQRVPHWQEDDPMGCSFPVDAGDPPARVSGRLRHWEETAGGGVRVGLHFVGLDSSPDQRGTLERVIRLAIRLQRVEVNRQGRKKRL